MAAQPTNGRRLAEMQHNITDPSVPTVTMKMRLKVAAWKSPADEDEEWFGFFLWIGQTKKRTAEREQICAAETIVERLNYRNMA